MSESHPRRSHSANGRSSETSSPQRRRLLITAGPTYEPIDAVRFLGNRSSGKLGIALAEAAADRGWDVALLLGPTCRSTEHPGVALHRFDTTQSLQDLLERHFPEADVLVMAAAVCDYRPKLPPGMVDPKTGKLKRLPEGMTLELESTPDLLAGCARNRREGQLLVGFALEPRDRLMESARGKLERKRIDLIVANPLETMNADSVDATLLAPDGPIAETGGPMPKDEFAPWLLAHVERLSAPLPHARQAR